MRRVLKLISANIVGEEEEIRILGDLLKKSNITSSDRNYDKLVDKVGTSLKFQHLYCIS